MEPLQDILATRPWAKLIKGNLVRDDVFGVTTKEEIDEALASGAIVKRNGKSCIPMVEIEATKKGTDYNVGDKIRVVDYRYFDFIAGRAKREAAKRYHDEAMNAALQGISPPNIPLDLDTSDIPNF